MSFDNFLATCASFWRLYIKPGMLEPTKKKEHATPLMKRIQMARILAFSFFCLGGISPQQLFAAPLTSTQADQTQVSLTIYNSNLGLVKDVREIELAAG